jgi:hypothetical protein
MLGGQRPLLYPPLDTCLAGLGRRTAASQDRPLQTVLSLGRITDDKALTALAQPNVSI